MSSVDLDGFGGPGGWDEAARRLGLRTVGIELNAAACATRAAAGHLTIRADVSQFPVERLAGKIRGSCWSPPCTTFSAAGKRAGVAVTDILGSLIRDLSAGHKTRARRRREMAHMLRVAGWPRARPPLRADHFPGSDWTLRREDQDAWKRQLLARKGSPQRQKREQMAASGGRPHLITRTQQSAAIWKAVRSASLVAEPARFIHACRPEWVALEQVPSVLPLWRVYAAEFGKMGYSVWCGTLNSADYGVPQTRVRAILIASRVRQVHPPVPTHYDPRKGDQLWGTPWVSMAQALGWGATERPAPTATAGGTATGGAEPFGHRDRDALSAEREAGRWVLRIDGQKNATCRPGHAPAGTIKAGHSSGEMCWVLHTNRGQEPDGTRQTADPSSAPALTAKSGGQWVVKSFRNNNNNNACTRSLDEPAGTLFFGGRSNWAGWTVERPATTVQGDPRVGRPGHKDRVNGGESQFAVDSVRITVQEAAVLQSFRPDYPWQGTRTAQFTQVGNAIPPLLAEAILSVAAGIAQERAA